MMAPLGGLVQNVPNTPKEPMPTQPLNYAPGSLATGRIWTVGTLVYTLSGLTLLFVWLLWGDFALSMRDRSVGPLIEKFLLKNGSSNTLKQILTSTLPTIIGLILGPAVSYMSDRARTKYGRRIPFLSFPTPIAGLAMVGIAFSPQIGESLWRFAGHQLAPGQDIHLAASTYTISVFTVFWTIFEVAVIISGSVFGGLINDVVPRPVLGRFHGLFRAISLYDGIIFNALLFPHAASHFTLMFALIGVLFGGGFLLMCVKVKEGQYAPPPPEEVHFPTKNIVQRCLIGGSIAGLVLSVAIMLMTMLTLVNQMGWDLISAKMLSIYGMIVGGTTIFGVALGSLVGMAVARQGKGWFVWWLLAFVYRFFALALGYLQECFTQPFYLLVFAMFIINGTTFRPINEFSIRYAAQLNMDDGNYGFILASSYLFSLVMAFPLGLLVDRFHPIRMSIFSMALYLAVTVYGAFYAHDIKTFAIALLAHTILSGTFFTSTASLGQRLLPGAKYSQYLSASGILGAFFSLAYAPVAGAVIDATKKTEILNGQTRDVFNYHMVFWAALVFCAIAMVLMFVIYRRFLAYGGFEGYVAPNDSDAKPSRHEPPKHLIPILFIYFLGALAGVAAGYVLLFMLAPVMPKGLVDLSGIDFTQVTLMNLHKHFMANSPAAGNLRNFASVCLATGVIPGATLGGIYGSRLGQRLENKQNAPS